MIKNKVPILLYMLMLPVAIGTSGISAAEPEPSAPDWQALALHAAQSPTFYYELLADGGKPEVDRKIREAESDPSAHMSAHEARTHVINQLRKARINLLDPNDANSTEIRRKLTSAGDVLENGQTEDLYQLLGHNTYVFIHSRYAPLVQTLAGSTDESLIKLRRVAQFFLSLSQEGKDAAAAAADATINIDLGTNPTVIKPEDDKIAPVLGKELFESIAKKHKTDLRNWATTNEPDDPTATPFYHNILKEYIRLLQCSIAGATCADATQAGKDGAKATEKSKSAVSGDKKDDKGATGAPGAGVGDSKKILNDANDKLGVALHYLKQAKSYISKVPTAERKYIKGKVTQILNDHKPIKDAVEKMKKNPLPGTDVFIQTVADIYKEASGF